jgi:hypothetical protein
VYVSETEECFVRKSALAVTLSVEGKKLVAFTIVS